MATTPMSFGTVCAPGQRYHPAIIAQAAATLAEMNPGRFWLSVGSGEALNEAITGEPWISKNARNARLETSVEVMRALWAGETVTTDGPVKVVEARLYDRPAEPPMIVGAALSPETARWMGRWADALITIAAERDTMREFDATASAKPRDVVDNIRSSPDIDRHFEWIRQDADMGFDRIYLHNVARDHEERFIAAAAQAARQAGWVSLQLQRHDASNAARMTVTRGGPLG